MPYCIRCGDDIQPKTRLEKRYYLCPRCLGNPRFWVEKRPEFGTEHVRDRTNTEPVCTVYSEFHPEAAEFIRQKLEEAWDEVKGQDEPLVEGAIP
jgi:DNA-directed RNA polymerase subunit RPC12/RpoP